MCAMRRKRLKITDLNKVLVFNYKKYWVGDRIDKSLGNQVFH